MLRLVEAASSSGAPPLDFAFGIGEDQSNEDMFSAVEALKDSDPPPQHIVSCTMGQKPSKAHFYLDSPTSVLSLLERFIAGPAEPACPAIGAQREPLGLLRQPALAVDLRRGAALRNV